MNDLISRAELFNKLSQIPIYASEERAKIYEVIQGMASAGSCGTCEFIGTEEWEEPCKRCMWSHKSYWRLGKNDE